MTKSSVVAICISPIAGGVMQQVDEVRTIAGCGLHGDRYCTGEGSFNKDKIGRRQVTLINQRFFPNSGYGYIHSRRNIVTAGVELMWLIGKDFQIGTSLFRGLTYCYPCDHPTKLSGKAISFKEAFFDCGGLVAEVLEGGLIKVGDAIVPPPKGH